MSRLIKPIRQTLEQPGKKVITIKMIGFSDQEVHEQAEEQRRSPDDLLNEARREAEHIIAQAKRDYEKVMEEISRQRHSWSEEKEALASAAKEAGYQNGWNEGQQQGYAEYRGLIQEARQIIEAAKKDYTAYLEASEKVILDIGVKIAGKIMAHKIEDDDYFLTLVSRALKEAKECHNIRLHVHPQSYEFVLSQKEELLSIFSHETNLFIYPDEEMTVGGCIIESETGRIDAGVDTQLSEIKKILTELLESETP
ncbi:flagellar assembly protein FliH [Bacillus benzoevorans]|uniref:Flagellar assembly protein FliH n=1 Tax=Bacillus benzoevorans TaxID=1456 RepID=A0A7X0HN42_9BACI|nr:flagellar assembly protein FliH [Bacillus benzoevorans]MBB6443842.1 flagellar assembly protein FliH [Bacillus benzoevorans]